MATTKTAKQVTFEAPEEFGAMAPQQQVKAVAAWCAANPTAKIAPISIGEGGLPVYLRRDTGKRADINRLMVEGVTVANFRPQAAKLGGGWTDLVAGLLGGYSRSATVYGTPQCTRRA